MTFGSLFAGIGGIDLGLERAGMTCKWQVESDDYCAKVLTKHWPDVRRHDDVRTFPPHAYGKSQSNGAQHEEERSGSQGTSRWYVDLIAAGFPCQDISYAGKGAGLAGDRSGLFWDTMRVVRVLEPRYVLLENVAALLSRGLSDVLGSLASLGYDAEWHCIPAAALGAPHIRDRVFIVAYTNCQRLEGAELQRQQFGISQRVSNSGWWATEPDVGRVATGIPNRMERLRGLGNAVVPQVAEWVGRRIMEQFDREHVACR